MYNKIIQFIHARIIISRAELEKTFDYIDLKTFAKGDYLLRIGEYCRFVGFLNSGAIVQTFMDNAGNEKAGNFIFDNNFFTYYEGLASHIPSHKNIIALEDCEVLLMSKDNLDLICKENHKFEMLLNQLLAEGVRKLLLLQQESKTNSIDERYLDLENQYSGIFQRVSMKYIADYLGIEPQSLSRLRRRLSRSDKK